MFNWIRAFMLMAAITVLFIVIGDMIGRRSRMALALLFAPGMNFFSCWFSDKMVLRIYNVREVNETNALQFYQTVQELAGHAGLPMPRVYLINEAQPNAFAAGYNSEHAVVAAAAGVLNILPKRELRGVMTHESAYVRHRDILVSTVSVTMVGAISALANFAVFFGGRDGEGHPANPAAGIAVAVLAPLVASLIQMAISRIREFGADRGGVTISGDPQALISMPDKTHRYAADIPFVAAEVHPTTAQMMIMNPLHGDGLANLFSTYSATEKRIARLMQMAQTEQYPV